MIRAHNLFNPMPLPGVAYIRRLPPPNCPQLRYRLKRRMKFHLHFSPLVVVSVGAIALPNCSSQQLYGAGQEWQKNECNKIMDTQERSHCMSSAKTSYEDYKRQSEAAKGSK
jgi:hypothetical protein